MKFDNNLQIIFLEIAHKFNLSYNDLREFIINVNFINDDFYMYLTEYLNIRDFQNVDSFLSNLKVCFYNYEEVYSSLKILNNNFKNINSSLSFSLKFSSDLDFY